uniref:Putative ribonuclease H-like domain-containing protein n=1 Tax=Tanacetum cinerariifolium TaxID=118510 RepID=A0A6L2P4Q3_TANCI|nr:putative ribonuclease H-like domain-containing protein [Tanacetum cinerariifolium]
MKEELLQFKIQNFWVLVDCPKGVRPIGTKWVLTNKKDERGIVIRNKAKLVAQGYTQEEEINYEEVFAPVARIEAIRLFLGYASFIGFVVYQMDVKSAFLYGTIDEEVYMMQPPGFEDLEFPDRVYKVEKAMYGLHQAPRAWYGTLSKYLLDNGFQRATIDQTLFIRKHKGEFLLVQVVKLAFYDYHNMVAILEKTEHNTDFHQIVDFLEASHIRIQTTDQETKIIATVDGKPRTISESSLRRHLKLNDEEGISSLPDAKLFENLSLMGYNILPNQSNIATTVVCLATSMVYNFSKMIFDGMVRYINNEHVSLSRHDRQGETFPTVSSFDAGQDRENIAKTSALPHESSPRVPSLDADEAKIKDQDLEISGLKARVKSLKDKDRRRAEPTQEDAPITRRIIDIWEELGAEKSTEKGSNDTEEMINVLSSMEAANILSSGGAATSVSPADVLPAFGVPTVSGSFPTISAIFTTASVVTPYTRRSRGIIIGSSQPMRIPIIGAKDKGKEKMIKTDVPKKRKLHEQIDAQVAREMEQEFSRENQRLSEQLARDSKMARLYAEEELKIMIEGLDRSNEVIAKHISEYEQAEADLSVGEKIELIEKFILVWKQFEDFVPMSSKEESKRVKRQGLKIDQGSSKRMKISDDVSEEEIKGMMQLVPLEEVYIEALQVQHPIIDWEIHSEGKREEDLHKLWTLVMETFSIKQATRDKEKGLWVELKRLFGPNFKDQLWTHHQAFMHDPLDWKLYDTCGVHHVSTKDQEIFMLVKKDYPLRKGLATVMISNKLQVEQYSQMASDLILKIHNIANSPR